MEVCGRKKHIFLLIANQQNMCSGNNGAILEGFISKPQESTSVIDYFAPDSMKKNYILLYTHTYT